MLPWQYVFWTEPPRFAVGSFLVAFLLALI